MITEFKRFNLDTLKIIDKIVKGEVEHTTEMETFDTEMNITMEIF